MCATLSQPVIIRTHNVELETAIAFRGAPDMALSSQTALDVVVVGGCGHIGLPLALALVDAGSHVGVLDKNVAKIAYVKGGRMPFQERGADELLAAALLSGRLEFDDRAEMVGRTGIVINVIGTLIDEFMNPSMRNFDRNIQQLIPHLKTRSLVILTSTVYPGTSERLMDLFDDLGNEVQVAFCPARISEGDALNELHTLPQIIGARTDEAFDRTKAVFSRLGVEVIRTTPREAEVAKLITNAWRYMKFAIANQFFEIAHRAGLDYGRILHAVRADYPRAADLPSPGLAAGPRLLQDTMHLSAFSSDYFPMGQTAMLVNEGLPAYIVDSLNRRRSLSGLTVGVLGMAYKGESDDPRNSLSYKLKKLLGFKGARVLCTDPYVSDPALLPLQRVVDESDVVVVAAPHEVYRDAELGGCEVVDIWGLRSGGIRL